MKSIVLLRKASLTITSHLWKYNMLAPQSGSLQKSEIKVTGQLFLLRESVWRSPLLLVGAGHLGCDPLICPSSLIPPFIFTCVLIFMSKFRLNYSLL